MLVIIRFFSFLVVRAANEHLFENQGFQWPLEAELTETPIRCSDE